MIVSGSLELNGVSITDMRFGSGISVMNLDWSIENSIMEGVIMRDVGLNGCSGICVIDGGSASKRRMEMMNQEY